MASASELRRSPYASATPLCASHCGISKAFWSPVADRMARSRLALGGSPGAGSSVRGRHSGDFAAGAPRYCSFPPGRLQLLGAIAGASANRIHGILMTSVRGYQAAYPPSIGRITVNWAWKRVWSGQAVCPHWSVPRDTIALKAQIRGLVPPCQEPRLNKERLQVAPDEATREVVVVRRPL